MQFGIGNDNVVPSIPQTRTFRFDFEVLFGALAAIFLTIPTFISKLLIAKFHPDFRHPSFEI